MPTKTPQSVNFYRTEFVDEVNRWLVERCRAGDTAALSEHIRRQDTGHPERFPDEYVENRPGMRLVLDLIAAVPGRLDIVDVACGNCELLKHLQRAGHAVTGIDVSPVRIERNRNAIPQLFEAFAETLPLPSAQADAVIALECLEHVMDLDRVLREIHRILRAGGVLLVTVPLGTAADGVNHVRHFTAATLRDAISGRGFHVLALGTLPYLNDEPHNNLFVAAVASTPDGPIARAIDRRLQAIARPPV